MTKNPSEDMRHYRDNIDEFKVPEEKRITPLVTSIGGNTTFFKRPHKPEDVSIQKRKAKPC